MKKMIMMLVAGVATFSVIGAGSLEERVMQLEERLSRIEKDLYTIGEKKIPSVEVADPKLVPLPPIEQRVLQAKINAFLKEHFQAQLGDPIDKYPEKIRPSMNQFRKIPVARNFHYFDKAAGGFRCGKLSSIYYYCEFDKKYSYASCLERIDQIQAHLAVAIGLPEDTFKQNRVYQMKDRSYRIACFDNGSGRSNLPQGLNSRTKWVFGVQLYHITLRNQLLREEENTGEKLP